MSYRKALQKVLEILKMRLMKGMNQKKISCFHVNGQTVTLLTELLFQSRCGVNAATGTSINLQLPRACMQILGKVKSIFCNDGRPSTMLYHKTASFEYGLNN